MQTKMLSQDIDFLKHDNKGDEVTNPATPIVVKLGNTSSNKEFGDSQSQSTQSIGRKKVKNEGKIREPVVVTNNNADEEDDEENFADFSAPLSPLLEKDNEPSMVYLITYAKANKKVFVHKMNFAKACKAAFGSKIVCYYACSE